MKFNTLPDDKSIKIELDVPKCLSGLVSKEIKELVPLQIKASKHPLCKKQYVLFGRTPEYHTGSDEHKKAKYLEDWCLQQVGPRLTGLRPIG